MAGRLLLLAACCCCFLALLPPPVQSRPLTADSINHRPPFPEPHFDAAEPTEQVNKRQETPAAWSPPPPAAGGIVTPELRTVPTGSNPLHNGRSPTLQERTSSAAAGSVVVVVPELRTVPTGSNPLHNRLSPTMQERTSSGSVRPELRWTPAERANNPSP